MTVIRDWFLGGGALAIPGSRQKPRERSSAFLPLFRRVRVWRERHRQRQELAMLTDRDLRDIGVPRELVEHEVRKWPWQRWHPQLQSFDDAIWRRITDQHADR